MNNPYSEKESIIYGSAFNHFYFYFEKFNFSPNFFESKIKVKEDIIEKLKEKGASLIYVHEAEYKRNNNKVEKIPEIVLEYKDSIIAIMASLSSSNPYSFDDENSFEKNNGVFCKVLYKEKETLLEIKSLFSYIKEKDKKNVYLLCKSDGMLIAQRFNIRLPEEDIDLELNYGKEIIPKCETLISNLESNKSGLALFSGPPGTGKSTFIKYLSTKTSRKIIYLPSSAADELTDPGFLTFMLDYKNCILLLEDAEKVLRSREINDNSAISNILNISDGLLGDCLNIFIIATFNTSKDEIDSALLRKGRLIVDHEFGVLPPENCNKIFEKIGSPRRTEESLSLSAIYNEQENFYEKNKSKKIGF